MALPSTILRSGTRATQTALSLGTSHAGLLFTITDENNVVEQWTGTAWQAFAGSGGFGTPRNALINGGFWQAQRQVPGTLTTYSDTASRTYTADRWAITNSTASIQYARGDSGTTPETGLLGRHYGRFVKITNTGKVVVSQTMMAEECDNMRGQTVRVQMKLKASTATTMRIVLLQLSSAGTIDVVPGIVASAPSGNFVSAFGADGTDPTWGTNLAAITPVSADNATIASTGLTCSVTTAWQRFGGTFTLPSDYKNLVLVVFTNAGIAAAVEFDIAEVGLYNGTPIRVWDDTEYQINTQRCYRYYVKTFGEAVAPAQNAGVSSAAIGTVSVAGASANTAGMTHRWPVTLRSGSPVITFYNPNNADAFVRNTTRGTNATATSAANTNGVGTDITFTGLAAWTIGDIVRVHLSADAEL